MKTIGLIGGTGWVSTLEYYRLLNLEVKRRLGGHEAARCILYSFNFGDVMRAAPRGAQAAVLGCTEIPLLLRQQDCSLPLFDTLGIHARAGVDFSLS